MIITSSPNSYPGCYDRFGENMYKKFKEHGYDYAVYSQWNTDLWNYTLPQEESDQRLLEERAMAEAAGVTFSNSHGPWRVPWRDATVEDRAERMEKMKRSVHNSRVLGAKYWIVHPIMPCGINEDNQPEAKTTWELNLRFMSELLDYAKKEDVVICLENMPMLKFSMGRPEDIVRFVEVMNDEHFRICLDTGHANIFDDITMGDALRTVQKYVKVLHVHDNFLNKDLHLYPFQGNTDWVDFSKTLREIRFDGIFELELNPPTRLPDNLFEEHAHLIKKLGDYVLSLGE